MSKLKWDQIGEKTYQTGVDHGVLYPQAGGKYPKGVAWNGLTNVTESPSGAEDSPLYADNIKYLNLKSAEQLGLTIECYTYPEEWSQCNGESELVEGIYLGQQRRNTFGFSYRTKVGNDTEGEDYGFLIHLVYGCSAAPAERSYATVNDSPEALTFSYTVSTTPIDVSGVGPDGKPYKPVASLLVDSTKFERTKIEQLEKILYGSDDVYTATTDTDFTAGKDYYEKAADGSYSKTADTTFDTNKTYYELTSAGTDGRLPLPDELKEIFAAG